MVSGLQSIFHNFSRLADFTVSIWHNRPELYDYGAWRVNTSSQFRDSSSAAGANEYPLDFFFYACSRVEVIAVKRFYWLLVFICECSYPWLRNKMKNRLRSSNRGSVSWWTSTSTWSAYGDEWVHIHCFILISSVHEVFALILGFKWCVCIIYHNVNSFRILREKHVMGTPWDFCIH